MKPDKLTSNLFLREAVEDWQEQARRSFKHFIPQIPAPQLRDEVQEEYDFYFVPSDLNGWMEPSEIQIANYSGLVNIEMTIDEYNLIFYSVAIKDPNAIKTMCDFYTAGKELNVSSPQIHFECNEHDGVLYLTLVYGMTHELSWLARSYRNAYSRDTAEELDKLLGNYPTEYPPAKTPAEKASEEHQREEEFLNYKEHEDDIVGQIHDEIPDLSSIHQELSTLGVPDHSRSAGPSSAPKMPKVTGAEEWLAQQDRLEALDAEHQKEKDEQAWERSHPKFKTKGQERDFDKWVLNNMGIKEGQELLRWLRTL